MTYGSTETPVHLDKAKFIQWMHDTASRNITFIRLAHESGKHEGDDKEYLHTHVVVEFETALETRNARYFDYEGFHPNITPVRRGDRNWAKVKDYLSKEDEDNKDLKMPTGRSKVEKVLKCDTLQEAYLENLESFCDAPGIRAIFDTRGSCEGWEEWAVVPDRGWQRNLIAEVSEPPDKFHRKIIWFIDHKGAAGKTVLGKYLMLSEPDRWYFTKDMGTSSDAATIIANAIASGWKGHGIIIDLPRSASRHIRMYSYLENILDGCITTTKYSGKTSCFRPPWVIVMANWGPDRSSLSVDRWDIRVLNYSVEADGD